MTPSCLVDPSVTLIVDTSTMINLSASKHAEIIVRAIPNRIVLIDTVVAELSIDRRTGRDDAKLAQLLIGSGHVFATSTADLRANYFEELVVGSAAETLDDGEAATIAYALETNSVPILDDRKALALCARKFRDLAVGSTVDIFAHEAVIAALGPKKLSDAVFSALTEARMRVLSRHENWVIELIGKARAQECSSLRGALRTDRKK